jgi:hypothetical protein
MTVRMMVDMTAPPAAAHVDKRVVLRDGTIATMRLTRSTDHDALRRFFHELSPESRRLRLPPPDVGTRSRWPLRYRNCAADIDFGGVMEAESALLSTSFFDRVDSARRGSAISAFTRMRVSSGTSDPGSNNMPRIRSI